MNPAQVAEATPWTFDRLTKNNFEPLNGLGRTLYVEQRNALEYINHMADLSQTDISDWDLLTVFEEQPGLILTDRRKINKRLVEYSNTVVREVPKGLEEADRKIVMASSKQFNAIVGQRKQTLTYNINSHLTSIRSYVERIETTTSNLRNARIELARLNEQPLPDIAGEVHKVLSGNFWVFHSKPTSVTRNLQFATVQPVVMNFANERAGIKWKVTLGKFIAVYDLQTGALTLKPHDPAINLMPTNYFHPYVSQGGTICWGNATALAAELQGQCKLADMMELLQGLLTTYTPDSNPYISLDRFKQEQDRHEKWASRFEEGAPKICPLCHGLERGAARCNCRYCEPCDKWHHEGTGCGGFYCDVCNTCMGSAPCEDHHCHVCGSDSRDPTECCCTECHSSIEACDC